ncbi:MAG: hypothetical protein QGG64_00535 [Candidatus Latescibacteria bacterium]|jgi:hypothetical protein|nr:hypothetical protein [Candidatus Latescibacterota bacterium]
MSESSSPFAQPAPDLRIKEGAPAIARPSKEEVEAFPAEGVKLLDKNRNAQQAVADRYNVDWAKGKHFVIAGGTGLGIGCSVATAAMNLVAKSGSLTVIARDLSKSLGYATGAEMEIRAKDAGMGGRFAWINDGVGLEGKTLDTIVNALNGMDAQDVIYINSVAAASSGLLPDHPPIFIKDVDEEGLFQWQLMPLAERAIAATKFVMGDMAVQFTDALQDSGISVAATAFCDWRGSLDKSGRDPSNVEYGRNGAYSTSLYLPKDSIQEATMAAYGTNRKVVNVFFPVMRTRALPFIPGGTTLSYVYDKLMEKTGIQRVDVPELGLGMLDAIGKTLAQDDFNPFPRLDAHEMPLDMWFLEVVKQLNENEGNPFYYKNWF